MAAPEAGERGRLSLEQPELFVDGEGALEVVGIAFFKSPSDR